MIYLVVALPAEARPLVAHFGLERASALEPLEVHRRPDLALIVSGVGLDASAAAVEELARAIPSEDHPVWINVGVAGHRSHPIGTVVLADEVVDPQTGESWRFPIPADPGALVGTVRTVQRVETDYDSAAVYEMEAAGFCRLATRLTSPELVRVLKVVSDNRKTGTLCVSARQVQLLIEDCLPLIDRVVSRLHRAARSLGIAHSSDQSPSEKPDSETKKNSPNGTRPS